MHLVVCEQVQPFEVAENSDVELESALSGARQRERAKSKKMKKMEMKKAQRLRGIIASGTNHGACALAPRSQTAAFTRRSSDVYVHLTLMQGTTLRRRTRSCSP